MFSFVTGEVIVAGKLDHARNPSYSMRIRAIDSLTGSWSDTICDVTVLDVNNHYPVFDKPYYFVQINENMVPGSWPHFDLISLVVLCPEDVNYTS